MPVAPMAPMAMELVATESSLAAGQHVEDTAEVDTVRDGTGVEAVLVVVVCKATELGKVVGMEPGEEAGTMDDGLEEDDIVDDGLVEVDTEGADLQDGSQVATGLTYCRQDQRTSEKQDPVTSPTH